MWLYASLRRLIFFAPLRYKQRSLVRRGVINKRHACTQKHIHLGRGMNDRPNYYTGFLLMTSLLGIWLLHPLYVQRTIQLAPWLFQRNDAGCFFFFNYSIWSAPVVNRILILADHDGTYGNYQQSHLGPSITADVSFLALSCTSNHFAILIFAQKSANKMHKTPFAL